MSGISTAEIRDWQCANMYADVACGDEMLRQRYIGYTIAKADAQAYPDNIVFAQVSRYMEEALSDYENQLLRVKYQTQNSKLAQLALAA